VAGARRRGAAADRGGAGPRRRAPGARRGFLRSHENEATRYAALKREVVARHPQDRLAYIEGKQEYVAALEARAVAWARDRA
jgi:hypothetical protein